MNSTKGIQLALITAVISGVSIFVNKFAVGTVGQPLVFTALKNSLVGILIVAVLIASKKWEKISLIKNKDKVYLGLIGIIGGSLPFYLFFTGLTQIPAINAAILHKTLVVWVAILAIPLLREKLTRTQAIGILLLFSSNLVIGGFKGFEFSRGELLVLAATLLWAVETIIAKRVLSNVDPDIVVASRMGIGAVVLMGASILTAPTALTNILSLSLIQWGLILATTVFLLGYVMSWYRALKHAPAIMVASVLVASTLVTNVLSAVFITHSWNATLTFQAILIVAGLTLFLYANRKQYPPLTFTSAS